jgi:hypothetical protein
MTEANNNVRELLDEVSRVHGEYETIYRANGSKFNIFSIAEIENRETVICKVIAELLNPSGRHYQGDAFLRIFVEKVLGIDSFDYQEAKVTTEYVIKDNRRIDILITSRNNIIPIEVKIYADDQENQCHDYHNYFSADNRYDNLFYLTLDGHAPSEYSASGLSPIYDTEFNEDNEAIIIGYEEINQISFKENIIEWLEECIRLPSVINISSIREIISQLIDVLKTLTDQLEENMETSVKEIIKEREEYLKCAYDIYAAFDELKKEMVEKVFDGFDEYIRGLYNLHRIANKYDYKKKKGKPSPGITYRLCSVGTNLQLLFRVELDSSGYLFLGFYIGENDNEWVKNLLPSIDELNIPARKSSDMWYHWEYFDTDVDNTPNFKVPNVAFFELAKDGDTNKFIKDAETKISTLLSYYNDVDRLKN